MVSTSNQKGWFKIKKEIKESYNLSIDKIYQKNEIKYFFVSNKKIYVEEINNEQLENLKEIVMSSNELYLIDNRKTRIILKCINDNYFFEYKRKKYILSYGENIENEKITIRDMLPEQIEKSKHKKLEINVLEKWKNTIDEIEKALVEYNKEYKELMKIVNYYIGLSENAIQLYISTNETVEIEYDCLGHSTESFDIDNFLSPLNIRKINKGNVLGKYIKYRLYNNIFSYKNIFDIKDMLVNKLDKYIFLETLMFQEEFFNEVKKLITDGKPKLDEKQILKYTRKINELEHVLRYVQEEIVYEPIINWLEE